MSGHEIRISNPKPGESPDLALWEELLGEGYAAEIREHKALQTALVPKKIEDGKIVVKKAAALVAKAVTAALLRVNGGPGSGNFGHGGRPGAIGGSTSAGGDSDSAVPLSDRVALARKSYKSAGVEKQRHAEENEAKLAAKLGGSSMHDSEPVDVSVRTEEGMLHGVEVKTMLDNSNSKITMNARALELKTAWKNTSRARLHTVVIDSRDVYQDGKHSALYSGNRLWYKRGVGSFRLSTMIKVRDEAHLIELMRKR